MQNRKGKLGEILKGSSSGPESEASSLPPEGLGSTNRACLDQTGEEGSRAAHRLQAELRR